MRGELVIVRAYRNRPLIRRVWDIGKRVVYITSEQEYQKLISGKPSIGAIGFPKEDVFKYDPNVAKDVDNHEICPIDWSKLTRFDWPPV
jgi:hypothetical protein